MTDPYKLPDNPGDPDSTDNEGTFPDEAENLSEEAARSQGGDEDDDLLTTAPDPIVDEDVDEFDPTREADLEGDVEAALDDIDAELGPDSETDGDGEATSVELQLAERTEDLQRLSAEYANYRRRTEREREGVIDTAKASVLTQLLPILDDLDLALQHGDLDDGPLKSFADKFTDTVTALKLTAFGAEGEEFDPEIHEAVQDLSSGEEKTVGTVLRKGYRVGDRLVRTAMVIIADPADGAKGGNAEQ